MHFSSRLNSSIQLSEGELKVLLKCRKSFSLSLSKTFGKLIRESYM